MTNEELIKLGKEDILKNHKQLYISKYTAVFGKAPSCASCTFAKDFRAFKEKILNFKESPKIKKMANKKEYKLSPRFGSTILSYQTEKGIIRMHGRNMTDEFAKNFLTHGSKKQIEERKKMFLEIPEKKEPAKVEKTKVEEVKEGDKVDINGMKVEGSYEVKSTDNAPKKSAPKKTKKRKSKK